MKRVDDQLLHGQALRLCGWVFLAVLAAGACFSAMAQSNPQAPPPADAASNKAASVPDKAADTPSHPADTPAQRKKDQLAADTAKLLQLANELKAEMDKSSKDMLSVGVMKKAEEVEKLAHKVRDEMKASIGN